MKHGRPWTGDFEFPIDDPYPNEARNALLYGWRREHAARVFQAIQALLWAHELVMSGADLAATEYERGFSDASESCLTRRAR